MHYIYMVAMIILVASLPSAATNRDSSYAFMILINAVLDLLQFGLMSYKKYDASYNIDCMKYALLSKSLTDVDMKQSHRSAGQVDGRKIRIGDIIKLVDGDVSPADVLLLATSDDISGRNICRLDVSIFEGNNDIQIRKAVPLTRGFNPQVDDEKNVRLFLNRLHARISYGKFSDGSIKGSFKLKNDHRVDALDESMVCRRGMIVKSRFVYGLVIYNGQLCFDEQIRHTQMNVRCNSIDRFAAKCSVGLFLVSILLSVLSVFVSKRLNEVDAIGRLLSHADLASFIALYASSIPTTVPAILSLFYILSGIILERKYNVSYKAMKQLIEDDISKTDIKRSFRILNSNKILSLGCVDDVFMEKTLILSSNTYDVKTLSSNSRIYFSKSSNFKKSVLDSQEVDMDLDEPSHDLDQSFNIPDSYKLSIPHFDFKTNKMGRTPFEENFNAEEAPLNNKEGSNTVGDINMAHKSTSSIEMNNLPKASKIKRKSIMDKIYDESQFNKDVISSNSEARGLLNLFSICHKSSYSNNKYPLLTSFQSDHIEEIALLNICKEYGIFFEGSTANTYRIRTGMKVQKVELILANDFDESSSC